MSEKIKVLFICRGNACRSQIAHGLLKELSSSSFNVFSPEWHPSQIHPISIVVMEEIEIDISKHTSDHVNEYLNNGINTVITLCDNAKDACPTFPENVERIHWSIKDPFRNWNFDLNQLSTFRETREEIKLRVLKFIKVYKRGK